MGKPRKHENSKDSKATLGVCDDLDKGKKEGDGALDLRSENGQLIDRLLRKTTHIYARTHTHTHACTCTRVRGRQIIAWQLRNSETQGVPG